MLSRKMLIWHQPSNKLTVINVLSCVEERIVARLYTKGHRIESCRVLWWQLYQKSTLLEAFLCSLSIITSHLLRALAYSHEFQTQLCITSCINSFPKKGVLQCSRRKNSDCCCLLLGFDPERCQAAFKRNLPETSLD